MLCANSNFCEKTRWALDLSPLREKYIEDAHPPILHITPAMRITKVREPLAIPLVLVSRLQVPPCGVPHRPFPDAPPPHVGTCLPPLSPPT
jgi:hypothetical protein